MAKSTRNYQQEYERRKAHAKRLGFSTAQARGHARKNEVPISTLKKMGLVKSSTPTTDRRFYKAIKAIATGQSLTKAAKRAHISPATIHKINTDREALVKDAATRRYVLKGTSTFDIPTKDGKLFKGVTLDKANASTVGKYWNAAQHSLGDSTSKRLREFRGKVIYDIHGQPYRLQTSVNDLRAMFDQMSSKETEDFGEKFYRSLRHAA